MDFRYFWLLVFFLFSALIHAENKKNGKPNEKGMEQKSEGVKYITTPGKKKSMRLKRDDEMNDADRMIQRNCQTIASNLKGLKIDSRLLNNPPKDINSVCRNFSTLSSKNKSEVYIQLVTGLASAETECNITPNANHQAKNAKGYGPWTMIQSDYKGNLAQDGQWVMDRITAQIYPDDKTKRPLFWENIHSNYFGPLQTKASDGGSGKRRLMAIMSSIDFCNPQKSKEKKKRNTVELAQDQEVNSSPQKKTKLDQHKQGLRELSSDQNISNKQNKNKNSYIIKKTDNYYRLSLKCNMSEKQIKKIVKKDSLRPGTEVILPAQCFESHSKEASTPGNQ